MVSSYEGKRPDLKKFWCQYHIKIIAAVLAGVLFIGIMSVIALFCGAIMSIFGFRCRSVGSAILFFIMGTVVSYPLSRIAGTLPRTLLYFGKISKGTAVPLYLLLDTVATMFGLKTVDYFMESVSATDFAIVVVSLLLALPGIRDIDEKPRGVG